jgi:hypothetical protein
MEAFFSEVALVKGILERIRRSLVKLQVGWAIWGWWTSPLFFEHNVCISCCVVVNFFPSSIPERASAFLGASSRESHQNSDMTASE